MKRAWLLGAATAALCFGGLGTPYAALDLTPPADWSYWYATGSMTETADGLSSTTNGSLIYSSLPADYEVRLRYKLVAGSGSYVAYFRATPDANLQANTGSFYAAEINNVSVTGGNCTASFTLHRRDGILTYSGAVRTIPCSLDMTLALAVRDTSLTIYRSDTQQLLYFEALPYLYPHPAQATILAGVGVAATPSGSGILRAEVFPLDLAGPPTTVVPTVSTSGDKIEIQWQGTLDPGAGLMFYQIWRRPNADPAGWVYRGTTTESAFVDRDVAIVNGAIYVYLTRAYDFHGNFTDSQHYSVTVPPAGAPDPRQVGIRPTGVYWGGAGEQIDLQSGNLNYTLPLLQPKSRTGWGATFALHYNSQMWRRDLGNNAIWYYGRNTGYGHGWRLTAGSILPVYRELFQVAFYLYTDSTGAEYRLDVNTGGVWTGKEGVFVSYEESTNRLYSNDGSFWVMGSESGGSEFDAGARYPTLMQDTNGNRLS